MSPVGSGMMLIILSDWGLQAEYLGQSLGTYTPAPSNPSSLGALQAHPKVGHGCLFSGVASSLDAFSSYPTRRSCPAVPCQTTGTPEATA